VAKLVFLDTETTSLNAETGEIWEGAAITRLPEPVLDDVEQSWLLPVSLDHADPIALNIGRFHDRHPQGNAEFRPENQRLTGIVEFATTLARVTHGAHLVGNVVSFDEERLRRLLLRYGCVPSWHYHLVDVEALVAGT
jgi:hypothetical protein